METSAGRPMSESLLGAPRAEPYMRLSRIPLPPWVVDGEANAWPGMKDARFWEPIIGEGLVAARKGGNLLFQTGHL
jgi:hypothetical protein